MVRVLKSPIWSSLACVGTAFALAGCAASLSPIEGRYARARARDGARQPFTVEFVVTHLEQSHGWDVVPKHRPAVVEAFDEVLADAVTELRNLSGYTVVTDEGPKGETEVQTRREFRTDRDYAIHLTILRESSFAAHAFWGLVAFSTGSLVPAPFRWVYTVRAEIYDSRGGAIADLRRSATVTNWIQTGLIVVYPFHPLEGKEEKLYSVALHDLFREMEAEGILVRRSPA